MCLSSNDDDLTSDGGLILFLVWKDQTPLKSRSAGKGALIGVITGVVLTILMYVILYVVVSNMG